eukprot:TRINITY_DN6926_c0_g1_i4.p1 TRINITY_DN6926_c0_g1~~TRINITY_DN6926_c0_g1_i4.p1  ORF type:complete len:110 (+),score=15.17 TRINITY_DN6926_c0_g1_i4:180-509(+)
MGSLLGPGKCHSIAREIRMELVLNSAKAMGCVVVNVGAKHLIEGRMCSFPRNVKRREPMIAEKWQRAEAWHSSNRTLLCLISQAPSLLQWLCSNSSFLSTGHSLTHCLL